MTDEKAEFTLEQIKQIREAAQYGAAETPASTVIQLCDMLLEREEEAANYRWMRYRVGSEEVKNILHGEYKRGPALDLALLAARKEGK